MVSWQMWFALAVMLYVGHIFSVGCCMGEFTVSAFASSGLALLAIDPEAQLRWFLGVSLVCIIWSRWGGGGSLCGRIGAFLLQEFARLRRITAGQMKDGG